MRKDVDGAMGDSDGSRNLLNGISNKKIPYSIQ
jgi:hypothetical protein